MSEEIMIAKTTINASPAIVFDLLADPSTHAAIDGTGWVRQPIDSMLLTHTGQVFWMGMYHDDHPGKHYEMANRVEVFDRPHAIAWQPGAEAQYTAGRVTATTPLSSTAGGSGATTSNPWGRGRPR